MSDRRWQTGLYIGDPNNYVATNSRMHQALYRWIFEFLTKVVGWTDVDSPDAGWDSVIASGVDGASDASNPTLFTAASATFSVSADINQYLTITGMTAPNEARNGIWKIKRVLSATKVELFTKLGVHPDGLPLALTGLSWRLWRCDGVTTNVPAYNAVAVVAGTGRTGAGVTNAGGPVGASSFSFAGGTVTLTDAGANFQSSDVGKTVVIANATTPGNNGSYTIVSRISATQITYANGAGATEAFGGLTTWKIRYKFHLRLQVFNGASYDTLGYQDISPWETWNAGTHAWNDSRHTATRTVQWVSAYYVWSLRMWAVADSDCVTFYFRTERRSNNVWAQHWNVWQFGEMDTFYPVVDPRPVHMLYSHQARDTSILALGTGYNWNNPVGNGVYMISWDEVTTLTGYLMYPHSPYNADRNFFWSARRRVSEYSKKLYRVPLIVESRTAGHMELRGTLRHLQCIQHTQPFSLQPFGAAHDWIHIQYGMAVPWHGGKQWYPYAGRSGAP